METIQRVVQQELMEKRYNRKHIDGYIREEILANPVMQARITQGIELVEEYRSKTYSYASKNLRIAQLANLDIEELVLDIFTGIAYCPRPELYTSVTAQLASRLKFDDKTDAIKTVAELVAVLCLTDAFDITKEGKMASLMVVSRMPLSDALIKTINESAYLPPMLCEPLELITNYCSGYLSHKDSVILGKGNHHDGDVCLDVLNTVNKVALRLDTKFLSTLEEDPTLEFTVEWAHKKAMEKGRVITDAVAKERVAKAIENWHKFKGQSYEFYKAMAVQGNNFYLTNKVDKRGRIYAQGYHITTQGTPFKKAMIELANEELVTGMP